MDKSKETLKLGLSILAGLVGYATIGSLGLYLLKACWTEYAKSSIDKSYTLEMLLSRLFVATIAAITAGILTTKTSKRQGKSIWFVAITIFSIAAYIHFFRVWTDYPIWYHLTYLLSIIPIIKLINYYLTEKD
ncbi:MAG: hypothetical protein U0U67_09580 [Chitinophagales bacterium]